MQEKYFAEPLSMQSLGHPKLINQLHIYGKQRSEVLFVLLKVLL